MYKNLLPIKKIFGKSLALKNDVYKNHIIKLNVYLTNLENFTKVNDHMEKIFTKPYPARAAIGIKELPKEALIEIDAIAETK